MKTCRNLSQTILTHPIEAPRSGIVTPQSKIFTMGSCFAYEIYCHLRDKGYNVLTRQLSDIEPELLWYNTYTMRYEFEKVVGKFTQEKSDYWSTHRGFQDPYRRFVFGSTVSELFRKTRELDRIIHEGITSADIVVLTLGLTEVFFQNTNHNAICATPGYGSGGGHDTYVRFTEYGENFDNVDRIIHLIKDINPKAKVIITVSPVPLGSTYSNSDHAVANTESKSILRAVAGAIVRKHSDMCYYFHSYELANSYDRSKVFIDDARHVNRSFVAYIMHEFEKQFVV